MVTPNPVGVKDVKFHYIYIYISLEAKYLKHLSAQLIHYIPPYLSTV